MVMMSMMMTVGNCCQCAVTISTDQLNPVFVVSFYRSREAMEGPKKEASENDLIHI